MSTAFSLTTSHAGGISPFAGADVCETAGLELEPGAVRPRFEDDTWFLDVARAPRSMRRYEKYLRFESIADDAWRLVAKEFCLALLAPHHEAVLALPHAFRKPFNPRTCRSMLMHLRNWLDFLHRHGITRLSHVTQDDCDAYLRQCLTRKDGAGPVSPGTTAPALKPVSYLALYAKLFTADAYAPGFLPWGANLPARSPDGTDSGTATPPRRFQTRCSSRCWPPPSTWSTPSARTWPRRCSRFASDKKRSAGCDPRAS